VTPPASSAATAQVAAPITWNDTLTGRFMQALFAAYYEECVRYVVLRNYERFPEHFGKDVDLVVHENDLALSHAIIGRVAGAMGLTMTVRRKRSGHLTYYVLPNRADGVEGGILIDVRPDVVHHGFVYLPGEMVLDSRHRLGRFYVPSAALESLAILLHCIIDTGAIRPSYRSRLLELRTGDPAEFRAAAAVVVGPALADQLAGALEVGNLDLTLALRARLMRAIGLRNLESVSRWLGARAGAVLDRVRAMLRPPGQIVVLVGPDGCGKTTSAELVCKRFAPTRVPVSAVYLGAQKPLLPTRKLSQKVRKRFGDPAKVKPIKDVDRRQRLRGLMHIMADKWLRYVVHVRPRLVRGEVVVLDRYFYDLRCYPHPLVRRPWLEAIVMALIPRPAVAFCLAAEPSVIAQRKNELTTAETARQIECYRGLGRWLRNFHELPADGDRRTVVDTMTEHVLRAYARHRSPSRMG
jgi:thymidylate kinase